MAELWYALNQLPDLTLNKYSSLEGSGVDGVIEKHIAFLRQLNRVGIVSELSFHLFYLYLKPEDQKKDTPGRRLHIFLLIRGEQDAMRNLPALIKASPLSDFFHFEAKCIDNGQKKILSLNALFECKGIPQPQFSVCSFLTKTETLLPASISEGEDYYILREWEMNNNGRLYNMCKMMEAINQTALYRVDLYPVERSNSLREALRKPMEILRKRQDDIFRGAKHDYIGKDVLDNYEKLIEKYDSSPHFISNIMVFSSNKEAASLILDAAGSESLLKGKYSISTFISRFSADSFLSRNVETLENLRNKAVMKKGRPGLIVCRDDTVGLNLNYLPTLFSLEEIAPFFRFPALYDGENIQIPKETSPKVVSEENGLFLGIDDNGYDVNLPIELLPKHAFISGVPGSGKTNTIYHLTSMLWKKYHVPFLLLEPAKKEYRRLANQEGMEELYIFSPCANMLFPLHINPFEFPKDMILSEHIRKLEEVFEGSFPMDPPAPFILDHAIEGVYRDKGWDPDRKNDLKLPYPTMQELYDKFEYAIEQTDYDKELKGNLKSVLQMRIGSLLRREMGDVFNVTKSTILPERWLEIPAVIELEAMGSGQANFLTLLLCALIREALEVDPDGQNTQIYAKLTKGGQAHLIHSGEKNNISVSEFFVDTEDLSASKEYTVTSSEGKAILTFYENNRYEYHDTLRKTSQKGDWELVDNELILTKGSKNVRHIVIIEEAHNLIGPDAEEITGAGANPKQAATAFVVKMLAEVRALREGIVIADQLPTVMAQEVLKNTGLKIALRITSADDRALLGSTMSASTRQIEEMATFDKGRSLISYEGLLRPFTMQTHEWCYKWNLPTCGTDNCYINCHYYAQGDCIPNKDARDKIKKHKRDEELANQIKDLAVYNEICERSVAIDGEKFVHEFKYLSSLVDDTIRHIDQLTRSGLEIEKLEMHIVEMSKELLSFPDRQEQIQLIQNEADHVTQLKLERKEKYFSSEKFRKSYNTIIQCVELLTRLERKKKHWVKLGFIEFAEKKYRKNYTPASKREAQAVAINNMQRSLFVDTFCLFHNVKRYLSDAHNVEKLLTELNDKLAINFIFESLENGGNYNG